MRKVHVDITVSVLIEAEDGVSISEVIQEMDYSMTSQTEGADIVDTELREIKVTDSR